MNFHVFVRGKKKMVEEEREVDLSYVSVTSAIEQLESVSADLVDASLDVEVAPYGGVLCTVRGYRPATKEEIATDRAEKLQRERDKERQKKQELEEALSLLKKERPELLKEEPWTP